jgi:hypothetical protein
VSAVPSTAGYEFGNWTGDIPDNDAANSVVDLVITGDATITAMFVKQADCTPLSSTEDLNARFKAAVTGTSPVYFCLQEGGSYLSGTAKIKVHGKIRFVIK